MITYKYKLYKTHRTKYLDQMLAEACFVWNHALALQKRHYSLYGTYINKNEMRKHFSKRYVRTYLHTHLMQEIIERLDKSYIAFFERKSQRPPKYKKNKYFSSLVFALNKSNGKMYLDDSKLEENVISFNKINRRYYFYKDRNYDGNIKRVILKRNKLGEYFIYIVTDAEPQKYGKSHNGASVGIDFGLKTYLTLSDGTRYENPQYMKENLNNLRRRSRNLSKCKKGSNNRERKRKELNRLWNDICNKRDDFQWKLAHDLCRKYDNIFIEDLNLADMSLGCKANRKLKDQAHAEFVTKLLYIATKYDVVVHKIDRYYPSSKTCTCGYVNKELKLTDRKWVCPHCGTTHDRDLLAANNILRRGIVELESNSKTKKHSVDGQLRYYPTISIKRV